MPNATEPRRPDAGLSLTRRRTVDHCVVSSALCPVA